MFGKSKKSKDMTAADAIKKMKDHHPELAKHLQQSIKTGILCRYEPERMTEWRFE